MIARLTIPGMTTVHAIRAVETALAMVPGITRYEVALGAATIVHDGRATSVALRDAVRIAGYEVEDVEEDGRRLY
ncbi:MAG TPA: heavy-metal-associated domain-containing protein [Gemmatimonadaceae bacterium]|nr:heavy-metal-associated domain-containing protein [Gemmatimonadaceae bacterium]